MRFPIDSSVDYTVNPANGYGMRMHPVYHEMRMHDGQDFGCLQGTPLYAMADGTVVSVGGAANNGAGGFFIFFFFFGFIYGYQHLRATVADELPKGTHVHEGQTIGHVGNTGASTSPHLHLTINAGTVGVQSGDTDPVAWCLSHGIAINGKQLTKQSNDGRIVLVVDGWLGPQTYKRLQQFLGVDQTGIFDDNTIIKLQKFLDVSVDGIFGPNSTKALQQLVGASVDGEWGGETTSKLQTWLNNN